MELHKKFLQKILTRAFFLLAPAADPWLLQAFFLLVAGYGSMLLFWSRSGKRT